ncbi:MAG: hypothetical protein JW820_03790 [Spirochaetales bacterium]|nr:hypothetical protein [Spirochaetales bacterium]
MLPRVRILIVLVAALGLATGAYAQEEGGLDFGLSLGLGANSFIENGTTVTYQSLSLSPDLAVGKFGIGLDVTLNYTTTGDPLGPPPADGFEFYVRREDWVPAGDQTFLDVYLPKIKYVRWGFKGDPLYIKLGSIDDGTLGNGFIMGGYDNTLFLPDLRIFGLAFDLDGALFNFPYLGLETFVGNLARFDVMGFRTYVRPLAGTEIPVIRNLQVGGSAALDLKPGLHSEAAGADSAEAVVLYGGDLRLPILATPVVSLVTYADVARLHNNESWGGAVGLGGRLFGFLTYGAQARLHEASFVPSYFDFAYDLFRYEEDPPGTPTGRYAVATGPRDSSFVAGYLGTLGFSLFADLLAFKATVQGPFMKPDPTDPGNPLNDPHLTMVLVLAEGLVPNVSFEALWDKSSIQSWGDLVSPVDAVIQGRLNYSIGAAVLSLLYQVRYEPDATPDPWVIQAGIQSSIKLF